MLAKTRVVRPWLVRNTTGLFLILICFLVGPASAGQGQDRAMPAANKFSLGESKYPAHLAVDQNAGSDQGFIPPGTILPIRLQCSISTDKSKPGQLIAGKIAQDVPLPNHSKIRAGSKVEGRIVKITPAGSTSGAKVSIQFGKVYSQGKAIPVTTNLRAIASFMEVMQAGVPEEAASEGTPSNWLTSTQVGGDSVYGVGGPVTSAENASEVVGKSVNDGVLSRVSAKEGTKCRGPVAGNANPQALWVFSSDACGTYGTEHVLISHAGRTDPVGIISLASDRSKLKIPSGTGMLLRVNSVSRD